jgi:hypothetical protein
MSQNQLTAIAFTIISAIAFTIISNVALLPPPSVMNFDCPGTDFSGRWISRVP